MAPRAAALVVGGTLVLTGWAPVALGGNCSLTPPAARANDCNGGGCECWCTPNEGAYTIWQWAPSGPVAGGPDTCCYNPASDPPCFAAKPLLSNTLGSHMVLQSAPRRAQLFGWADPGDVITVVLEPEGPTAGQRQQLTARAANDTSWSVSLAPVAAGGPYNISVRSAKLADGVQLVDVLFGELWMCGGQSNMELTVQQAFNASAELARSSSYPTIRLFTVGQEYADTSRGPYRQLRSVWQDWAVASPQSLGAGNWTVFSAACWFFGRALQERLQVPVGLVSNNWGGTSIAPWMSPDAIKACPLSSFFPPGSADDGVESPHAARVGGSARPMPSAPSVLWDTMVAPLTRQTFRGVVFYQGESNAVCGKNAEAAKYYGCAINALISDWRKKFAGGGDLAFHQTLLAPINTVWGFAGIRIGQQAALGQVNSGIASAVDSGDPYGPWQGTLHPRDKQTLGQRLSLVARALTYGEAALTFEGPRMAAVAVARQQAGTVRATVSFVPRSLGAPNATKRGLVLRANPVEGTLAAGCGSSPSESRAGANALCGYFAMIFGAANGTEQSVYAVPSLSADATELVLTAKAPAGNATLLRVEAMNNEWPVVRVYNEAGLPMFPFVHQVAAPTVSPPAAPAQQLWCPALHTIQGNDPSGPILVDGTWHVFVTCDDGPSWGHYTSTDLCHWSQQQPTQWDSATGSVAPSPANPGSFLAFWPNTSTPFPCCDILGATATNASLQGWRRTGTAIRRPTDLTLHQGFRDPHRPIKIQGKWRMGVGSGSGADNSVPLAGRIRWFTAADDTLSTWHDSGIFWEVNSTVAGYVDANKGVVWNESWRRPLDQIECPDVFELNGSLVVLGSLQYDGPWQGTSTTWWIGQADENGTRFLPNPGALGLCDYGQSYAVRHGEGLDGRRILFGFSGWASPTLEPGCGSYHGMYHVFAREARIAHGDAPRLQVSPVAEIAAHMRRTQLADAQPVARSTAGEEDVAVAKGSQLDVEMHCRLGEGMAVPSSGQVSLEVLADPSPGSSSAGGAALVVGYDFATERLFVDHARMGNATILQTAPLPRAHLPLAAGGAPLIRVLVDNAMIESFGGGEVALTSFVTPTGDAAPEARVARAGKSTDGVACTVSAWVLGL